MQYQSSSNQLIRGAGREAMRSSICALTIQSRTVWIVVLVVEHIHKLASTVISAGAEFAAPSLPPLRSFLWVLTSVLV